MSSFFEKLKKGMNINEPVSFKEEIEEVEEKEIKKEEIKEKAEKKSTSRKKLNSKTEAPKIKKLSLEPALIVSEKKEEIDLEKKWPKDEQGELVVDLFQTENELILQSPIAGVTPENLDISVEKEILTIRGYRPQPLEISSQKVDYFNQECFWGPFFKEIILPVEIDPLHTQASFKNGVLIIKMPKIDRERKRKIIIE